MPITEACLGDLFQPVTPVKLCESIVNVLPLCACRKPDGCVRTNFVPESHCLRVVLRIHHPLDQLASVSGGRAGAGKLNGDDAYRPEWQDLLGRRPLPAENVRRVRQSEHVKPRLGLGSADGVAICRQQQAAPVRRSFAREGVSRGEPGCLEDWQESPEGTFPFAQLLVAITGQCPPCLADAVLHRPFGRIRGACSPRVGQFPLESDVMALSLLTQGES